MFTGIISNIGTIESADAAGDLKLKVVCDFKPDMLKVGASIAVDGVCLTVTAKGFLASGKTYFTTSVSQETLSRIVPGRWDKGARVNLEQALRVGDRLDGHLVTGHVDGLGMIRAITQTGDSYVLEVEAPENLARFMAEKGSVTLDGVSLTVNQVRGNHLWVNVIPHSWAVTTFGDRKQGDRVHIEIDLIARYVARLMKNRE